MDYEHIKEIIYDALRPYYRPISQNKLWELVQDKFYIFEPIVQSNPPKMEKKLVQSRTFSKSTFKKGLDELVGDGRVYVYDDKETKLGKRLYYAKIAHGELRDLISSRLDVMLDVYKEKLDSILGNFANFDNSERAKILWKSHLLLYTAESQVKLYFEIFPDKLNIESLLSRIQNMRNTLDDTSHSVGISNYKELIQILLNEVVHTAIMYNDSMDAHST